MKVWLLALLSCTCTGCTMMSLERHTLGQTESAIDLRYREVMHNLALIAADPSSLPSYASIFSGTVTVTDQQQVISTTIWQHMKGAGGQEGFASQAANPSVNRQIIQNWNLDPLVVPEKLEVMRAACQWVIGGPEHVYRDSFPLLIGPDQAPVGPQRHFDIAKYLERLPPGWLQVGCLKDVPLGACYKAHCGGTWVWVMPEGMKGLADFTLIMQNIARVDSNSPTLFHFPPSYSAIRVGSADSPVYEKPDKKGRQIRVTATVYVDQGGNLIPDIPYYPMRQENRGLDSKFKSQINAAGATPH
jgi:hypothetical protein